MNNLPVGKRPSVLLVATCCLLLALLGGCPQRTPRGGGGGPTGTDGTRSIPRDMQPSDPDDFEKDSETGVRVVRNELLVVVEEVTPDLIERIENSVDGEVVGAIPEMNMIQVQLGEHVTTEDTRKMMEVLKELDGIRSVSPNAVMDPAAWYPVDGEEFGERDWNLDDPAGRNWPLEFIRAPLAWDLTTGNEGTVVGIIDFGFYPQHSDISKNVIACPTDAEGARQRHTEHGTHVSGIVAAVADNGRGIAGLAPSCGLRLFRVVTDADLVMALRAAVERGCTVVNFSGGLKWGHVPGTKRDEAMVNSSESFWWFVLDYLRENDVIFVQAAGNGVPHWLPLLPPRPIDARWNVPSGLAPEFDNYIVVGNATRQATLAPSSNFGDCVTVAAPGTEIWSCVSGDGIDQMSGTSMAAPFVTGLCALVRSLDPSLTAGEVKKLITEAAEACGNALDNGNFFIIDAWETIRRAQDARATDTILVMDVSDSMGEDGKLSAAKKAAARIVDEIEALNSAGLHHRFGLVAFNDTIIATAQPSGQLDSLRARLAGLSEESMTDLAAATESAYDLLENSTAGERSIIFMTDGKHTVSSPPQSAVLRRCTAHGTAIPIHTVAFGHDADKDLLAEMSHTTGGTAVTAVDAFGLIAAYRQNIHRSTGQLVANKSGVAAPGEVLQLASLTLSPQSAASSGMVSGQGPSAPVVAGADRSKILGSTVAATLDWEAGDCDLTITDPLGRKVDECYPDATVVSGDESQLVVFRDVVPGKWEFEASARNAPDDGTRYSFAVSSNGVEAVQTATLTGGGGGPPPGAGPQRCDDGLLVALIVMIWLIIAALVAMLVVARRSRVSPGPGLVMLKIKDDSGIRAYRLAGSESSVIIGRAADADIRTDHPKVSGRHARVSYDSEMNTVTLEDLGSTNGTFVQVRDERHRRTWRRISTRRIPFDVPFSLGGEVQVCVYLREHP